MEESGVKLIVSIIICVIIFIVVLSIIFIFNKVKKEIDKGTTTTTEVLNFSSINCSREYVENKITKREEIALIYNNKELYEYDIKYIYTGNSTIDRDYILSYLNSKADLEYKDLKDGISTSLTSLKDGGELTIKYDLKSTYVRTYVNSTFFNKKLYRDEQKIYETLYELNYKCDTELVIN